MGELSAYTKRIGVLSVFALALTYSNSAFAVKEQLAALVACGLENQPDSEAKWEKYQKDYRKVQLDPEYHSGFAPDNYECAKWILKKLGSEYDQQDYCVTLAKSLGSVATGGGRSISSSGLDRVRSDDSDDGDDETESNCNELDTYKGFQSCVAHLQEENQRKGRKSAIEIKRVCESLGVNMDSYRLTGRRRVTSSERSGVHYNGDGACINGGGVTIVKEPAWASAGKMVLSYLNNKQAMDVMRDGAHDQQETARLVAGYDHDLGYGSSVTSGSHYGYGYGSLGYGAYGQGYGCSGGAVGVYGAGGCNGGSYYPGMNNAGGYYSGYSGGCPMGACYGNGGVVVGGNYGNVCGVPPYNAGGCGNNMQGGGYYPAPASMYGAQNGYYGNGVSNGAYLPGVYGNGNGGSGYYPGGYYPQNGMNNNNGMYNNGMYNNMNGMYGQNGANLQRQQYQMQMQYLQFMQSQQTKLDRNAAQSARLYQKDLDKVNYYGRDAYQQYDAYQGYSGGGNNAPSYYPP